MAGRTERRSGPSSKRGKPNSGRKKQPTGGSASIPQKRTEMDNRSIAPTEKYTGPKNDERNFDLLIDEVPYFVKATPFDFNGELRFSVRINNGTEHIFTWDSDLKALRAIDDDSSTLPDSLEEAISQRLQSKER